MDKKTKTEKKSKIEAINVTGLSRDEVQKKLIKSRRDLLELRFQKSAQQLGNYQKLGQHRREIARLMTALNKKETK